MQKCIDMGCSRIVLILTGPKDFRKNSEADRFSVRLLRRKYPNAAVAMKKRAQTYNAAFDEAVRLEKQGKVLIIAPDDIGQMKTLTKDRQMIDALYQKGLQDAEKLL